MVTASAVGFAALAAAAVALAVAADSAALLVAVGPTRYSAPFLDN